MRTLKDAHLDARDLLLVCIVGPCASPGALGALTGAWGCGASPAVATGVLCLSLVFDALILRWLLHAMATRRELVVTQADDDSVQAVD